MNDFEKLVDLIVDNPEKHFTSFLYESSEDDLILLLNKIILMPKNGHQTVVRCLILWQDLMEFEHGLDPLITELTQADREDSAISCLKLINRLIKLSPSTSSRIRIRHELIELGIYDRIEDLRKNFPSNRQLLLLREEASSLLQPSPTTSVDCFNKSFLDSDSGTYSSSDEEMTSASPELSEIDNEFIRLLNSDEAKRYQQQLITLFSDIVKNLSDDGDTKLKKIEAAFKNEESKPSSSTPATIKLPSVAPPMPPPPPPVLKTPLKGGPPPPPPPLSKGSGGPPPPPPNLFGKGGVSVNQPEKTHIPEALKLSIMPPAGKKFRKLQWTKIPSSAITQEKAKKSIWQRLESVHQIFKNKLELNQLDELFECSTVSVNTTSNVNDKAGKTVKPQILDSKRKMNVGIFLKQFKDIDLLLQNIYDGNIDGIEQEKLKVMEGILPNSSEIVILQNYTGDIKSLENAEIFFMKLIKIPDYQLRISTMSFRSDFTSYMNDTEKQLSIILIGCKELLTSESLRRIFYLFLHMGNYLNADGKTVGFKLNTLWSIDSMRATNKDGLSLIHLVAQRMKDCIDDMKDELKTINESAQIPLENIKDETNAFNERLKTLINRVENKNDDKYFTFIKEYLIDVKEKIEYIQKILADIEANRLELALYFCEQEKTFKLEECFKIFSTFLTRFYNAASDNQKREERENRRKNAKQNEQKDKENEKIAEKTTDIHDDMKSKLFDILTAPSTNNNLIQYGSGERRRSVMCVSDRERVESPIIRRKFSSAARTPQYDKMFLGAENLRKDNTSPIFEGTSLDACIDEALDKKQSIPRRAPSPKYESNNDSGVDSISVKTTSEISSSTSTNVSPVISNNNNKADDNNKHSAKMVRLDSSTISSTKTETTTTIKPISNKIKISQKLPDVPPSKWSSISSITKNNGQTNNAKTHIKSAVSAMKNGTNLSLPPRPPTSIPNGKGKITTTQSLEQKDGGSNLQKSKYTPALMNALKTARTVSAAPESRKPTSERQIISNRPSQVRANSLKKLAECPSTLPAKKPQPRLVSSFTKPAESPTTQRRLISSESSSSLSTPGLNKPISVRSTVIKSSTKPISTSSIIINPSSSKRKTTMASPRPLLGNSSTRQSFRSSVSSTSSNTSSSSRKPLTAAEKRALQMKPADSVSTASRPTMIRTGSTTERPRWI